MLKRVGVSGYIKVCKPMAFSRDWQLELWMWGGRVNFMLLEFIPLDDVGVGVLFSNLSIIPRLRWCLSLKQSAQLRSSILLISSILWDLKSEINQSAWYYKDRCNLINRIRQLCSAWLHGIHIHGKSAGEYQPEVYYAPLSFELQPCMLS